MSLSVGIVGLPNAGKSTLFNALAAKRIAETAPRPFTTIDPHEAAVPVPDAYLEKLSELIRPQTTVPASVTFIDIAGLVKGAHRGEGLGNQFLSKIREVDAIAHVVRGFRDPYVTHQHPAHEVGSVEQIIYDIEIIKLELQLANVIKPEIIVVNVGEIQLDRDNVNTLTSKLSTKFDNKVVVVSAKLEEELIDFSEKEQEEYLKKSGIENTSLNKLVRSAYETLNLISFYTIKGGEEVSAWSVERESDIIEAAKKVHTDFAEKFIKAEVINVEELLELGGWKEAKGKGKIQVEGRDYVVKDKDVIEFKIGQ